MSHKSRFVALALMLGMLFACGGGESTVEPLAAAVAESAEPTSTPTPPPPATATPAPTPTVVEVAESARVVPEPTATPVPTPEPTPIPDDDWTVMVYVMGDNDLEPFAVTDLLEMAQVGSSESVNVIALIDRAPEYLDDAQGGIENFEDTRLFYFEKGALTPDAELGELNTGDPDVLADFIATSIADFPAKQYATILWNHGAGWPGVGPDETDDFDMLDLAEINEAFEAGLAAVGLDSIDLVGFDACLMASYEVAATMAEHADFMLASEELEPGHGWNYLALEALSANPELSTEELGSNIIDGFVTQAANQGTGSDITLSLLDLREMAPLEQALGDLAAPLIADPQAAAPLLAAAQSGSLAFATNPDPELASNQIDLGNVVSLLGESRDDLAEPAANVLAALDTLVVANSTGPASSAATGLSIYFPAVREYFRQGYLFLEGVPVWPDLLTSYYTAGDEIPFESQAAFIGGDEGVEVEIDQDGLSMFAAFDESAAETIVDATISYGILDESDDSIIFLGVEQAETFDDGSVFGFYDLMLFTISDGIDTEFVYLDFSFDEEAEILIFDVPFEYWSERALDGEDDPSDVILNLILDLEGNLVSEVYYAINSETGAAGELNADPEGLMFPLVLNQFPDGTSEWLTLSEVGLFAELQFLEYELVPIEPGTGLYTELAVTDYGGNTDTVSSFQILGG